MKPAHVSSAEVLGRSEIARRYRAVRGLSMHLAEPLSPEDMIVQVAPCASPTKWHLAHTTWFFETFVLAPHEPGFARYAEQFDVLFNSYYNAVGPQHPRPQRGLLTRPGLGEVMAYRDTIDDRLTGLVQACGSQTLQQIAPLVLLGLQHEQQHQELLLTDIKLLLHANPLWPAYRMRDASDDAPRPAAPGPIEWVECDGGVVEIGHEGPGFAYDNEGPRHRRFVEPFAMADRPVTSGEFLAFVEDGGYTEPRLWLDEGWSKVRNEGWSHPLYWRRDDDGAWREFTLDGPRPIDPDAPACHLSFFEADAYARWTGGRLPTEVEWEHLASDAAIDGNFVESGRLRPVAAAPAPDASGCRQLYGDVWEWTRSAHEPYPGYSPPRGAVGEYNGKFMCGSYVLRGGSCASSRSHLRATYRNFFDPAARWQFSGVRLARNI